MRHREWISPNGDYAPGYALAGLAGKRKVSISCLRKGMEPYIPIDKSRGLTALSVTEDRERFA